MQWNRVLLQLVITALVVFEASAWRGDEGAFDGAIGEYVRTLRKSYRDDGSLAAADNHRGRAMKSDKSGSKSQKSTKAPKSPAPTVASITCPPSVFVAAPSKKSKVSVKTRKTRKSVKSCKATSAPAASAAATTTGTTCGPTAAPVALSGKKAKSAQNVFSCKFASSGKTTRRMRV